MTTQISERLQRLISIAEDLTPAGLDADAYNRDVWTFFERELGDGVLERADAFALAAELGGLMDGNASILDIGRADCGGDGTDLVLEIRESILWSVLHMSADARAERAFRAGIANEAQRLAEEPIPGWVVPGAHVRFRRDVDRFPQTVIKAGATGVVAYIESEGSVYVRLDHEDGNLDEWGNCCVWYPEKISGPPSQLSELAEDIEPTGATHYLCDGMSAPIPCTRQDPYGPERGHYAVFRGLGEAPGDGYVLRPVSAIGVEAYRRALPDAATHADLDLGLFAIPVTPAGCWEPGRWDGPE